MNPLTDLSPFALIVMLVTLLLGVLTQIKNTGKVLGQWVVPPSAMVWIMMVLPFLAAAGASFTQAGTLTVLSAVNAIIAGVWAVLAGAVPGGVVHLALHAHLVVPVQAAQKLSAYRAMRGAANDNAAQAAQPPKPKEAA